MRARPSTKIPLPDNENSTKNGVFPSTYGGIFVLVEFPPNTIPPKKHCPTQRWQL
jgi:hypothetical protein